MRKFRPMDAKKATRFVCITLRQWAILFSILLFIITAIVTTCTVLGTLHTKQLLQLLETDIEEEHHKNGLEEGISSNEARLQHSQSIVLTFSKVLSISMWFSWSNLVLAGLLIYGVTTKTPIYIIPWLVLSATSFLLAVTTLVMIYFQLIPGLSLSYGALLACLGSSLVIVEMWYTIVLYYASLGRCAYASYTPTVVHAYGGYTHTTQPMKGPNKLLV